MLYPVFLPDPVPAAAFGPAGSPPGFEILFLFRGEEEITVRAVTNLAARKYAELKAIVRPAATDSETAGSARRLLQRECQSAIVQLSLFRHHGYPMYIPETQRDSYFNI